MHTAPDLFPALGLVAPTQHSAAGDSTIDYRAQRRGARERRLRRLAEAGGVQGLTGHPARHRPSGGGLLTQVEIDGRRRAARSVTATFLRHPFGESLVRARTKGISGRTQPLRP